MTLPNRHGSTDDYSYGFNGMEKDDEVKGEGNSYTTHFRQYDPSIGRWITVDPVTMHYSSPYVAFSNIPITNVDPDGNCDTCPDPEDSKTHTDDAGIKYNFEDGLWKIEGIGLTQEEVKKFFDDFAEKVPDALKDISDKLDESGNQVSFSIKFRSKYSISANTSGKISLTYSEGSGFKIYGFTVAGLAEKASLTYDLKTKKLGVSTTGEVDFLGWNYRNTSSIDTEGNKKVMESDLDIAIKWSNKALSVTYRMDLSKYSAPANQGAGGYGISQMQTRRAIGNINKINLGDSTGPFAATTTIPRTVRHTTEWHFKNPFKGMWKKIKGIFSSKMPTSSGGWFTPN